MDKGLELEAEEYKQSTANKMAIEKSAFIAGATSKYVEKQKLEFAIEQLNNIQINVFAAFAEYEVVKSTLQMLSKQISELEQKLNGL